MKHSILLVAFCFLSIGGTTLSAQKTLILPLEVIFLDASKKVKATGMMKSLKKEDLQIMDAMMNQRKIPEEEQALRQVILATLGATLEETSDDYKLISADDLPPHLQTLLASKMPYISFALSPKSMLIGRKRAESDQSAQFAPLMNQLCDEFSVERVLFFSIKAYNFRAGYVEKGKAPFGYAFADGKLFDGDSGLVIKAKSKQKRSGNGVQLIPQTINTIFESLLKTIILRD